jgi:Cd2+/Zn2+-exporting ATPase
MPDHDNVFPSGQAALGALPMARLAPCCCGGQCHASRSSSWLSRNEGLALVAAVLAEAAEWFQLAVPWLPALGALFAIAACGLPVYKKGWLALKNRDLNINALMSLAATGALFLGQFPEAAMVLVLFALAERLEAASLDRAQRAVTGLLALAPETAFLRQADGSFALVAAAAVPVGAAIRLRPGDRVALDGLVSEGRSSVDQSPITGESLPVDKGPGDALYAGSINREGELLYATTARADDSTLARIIRAVTAAPGKQAQMKRFVDRFAAVYTPAVVVLALCLAVLPPLVLDGDWAGWVYKALVLLIIACPCALVISTPVTVVSGLAAAARRGILIKGGLFLEQGHAIATLVLDKTGTVTTGRPTQTAVVDLAGDPVRNRRLAASLAERSDHPVSRAVAEAARRDGLSPLPVSAFTARPGQGVAGSIEGRPYHLGNHRQIEALGLGSPAVAAALAPLEQAGQSVVLLAEASGVLALFAVADTVREHSRRAVAELHALGVETILLSGDNAATAQAIAREVGIDLARGEQLPEDKAAAVDALIARKDRRGLVAMVGDGINDAPALARSHIGLAMGAAGSDAAIETADVAIMDDDLRKIAAFIRLSRRSVAILRQNIALALGLKGLVLALTVCGYGSMLLAVFADMGTSLLVIGNGLRVLRK